MLRRKKLLLKLLFLFNYNILTEKFSCMSKSHYDTTVLFKAKVQNPYKYVDLHYIIFYSFKTKPQEGT